DRLGDRNLFLGRRFEQIPEPVAQKGPIDRIVLNAERVEPGAGAARNPFVAAADRADEDLRSAVLVEQDRARRELLRLSGEEVQHHGLPRTRWPDDREVAEVAFVEVEEERRRAGRLEDGDRFAPMIATGAAHRETVKRDEAGSV